MKIQFALTKPNTATPNSRTGSSYLTGLVVSTREFADFDIMPIEFSKGSSPGSPQDEVSFVLSDKHLDNLARRHKYPERVLNEMFPALLDTSLWRIPKATQPTGEFFLVKTQMPGLAEGEHAYAITGVLKGKPGYLRDICERVYENTADLVQGVMTSTGTAHYNGTSITLEEKRGLFWDPDSMHTKHVWGFSEEKFAIMAMASIDVIERHTADLKHLIEHGTHSSNEFGRNPPPPEMLEFVREMSARGLFPPRMCETKAQTEERENVSGELQRAAKEKFLAENPDYPEDGFAAGWICDDLPSAPRWQWIFGACLMTLHDLTPDSAKTIESLIVISCELFILQIEKAKREGIETQLKAAEDLAGQILEHYGSLAKASDALSEHRLRDDRLPFDVLQTLLYASVREHPKLGLFLDELYSLYRSRRVDSETPIFDGLFQGAMSMNEMSVIPSLMTDSRFSEIPSPSMLDAGGNLQYQPAALSLIQGAAAMYQISRQFNGGVRGIRLLLSQYPAMDEDSRKWMDGELAKRVYHAALADDHPVRQLLQDKLEELDEAKVRLRKMFDGVTISTVPNPDEREGFMHQLGKAFDLLERMPSEKAALAFVELNLVMREWMGKDSGRLTNCFEPVKCLAALMERAKPLGFDPVERLIPILEYPDGRIGVLRYLLKRVDLDVDSNQKKDVLSKAVLLSVDDEQLLGLGLDETKLAKLADVKDSHVLRQALLKTSKGRDAIFGQDLGI